MDLISVWPSVYGVLAMMIAVAAVASNMLTLLALRERYGLRKVLGKATCVIIGCLSATNLLQGFVGVPSQALDVALGQNWPPFSLSASWRAVWCGLTLFPSTVLYDISTWYLLAMAVVRCTLVWWPQAARDLLRKPLVIAVVCMIPVIIGTVGTMFGFVAHDMRMDKHGDHRCHAVPYDPTPTSKIRFSRYQASQLMLFLVVPEPTGLILYAILYIKLLVSKKKSLHGVVQNEAIAIHVNPVQASPVLNNNNTNTTPTSPANANPTPQPRNDGRVAPRHSAAVHLPLQASFRRKLQVIKILAAVYVCDLACVCPVYIAWISGLYTSAWIGSYQPIVSDIFKLVYFMAIPMNSLAFAIVSKDFKRAYKNVLKCG